MVDYGLKGRVALITGVNNPQGIGAPRPWRLHTKGQSWFWSIRKSIDRLILIRPAKTAWTGIMLQMPGMRIMLRADFEK